LEVFRWNQARRNINIRRKKQVSIPMKETMFSITIWLSNACALS